MDSTTTIPGQLFESIDSVAIATDLDGLVTHWNAAAARYHGFAGTAALGRPIVDLIAKEDRRTADTIGHSVKSQGRWDGEIELSWSDGRTFLAYVQVVVLRGVNGQPTGYAGTAGIPREPGIGDAQGYFIGWPTPIGVAAGSV
jgi:PAS domain S-box-containing protein